MKSMVYSTDHHAKQGKRPKLENVPGVAWRLRRIGWEARWQPRTDLIQRGYPKTTSTLWAGWELGADDALRIQRQSRELQDRMLLWGHGGGLTADKTNRVHMPGDVYFMTDDIEIKIGYSGSPIIRSKSLKKERGREVRIIHAIPGTIDDEKALHRRFKHLQTTGEWFRPELELLEFIQLLACPSSVIRAQPAP